MLENEPANEPESGAGSAKPEDRPQATPMVTFQPPAPLFQPPELGTTEERPTRRKRTRRSSERTETGAEEKVDAKDGGQQDSGQQSGGRPEGESSDDDVKGTERASEPAGEQTSGDGGNEGAEGAGEGESGEGGRRRRRRRGGRRRNRGDSDGSAEESTGGVESDTRGSDRDEQGASGQDDQDDTGSGSRRRRRRRRRKGEAAEPAPDDPENTVVRVREPRKESQVTTLEGSTRLEAKKQRRREGREAGRRRPPILTEAEFLARRESVERAMVIRQRGERTQIGVLEDNVLVEHYVAKNTQSSLIGNVYLGRVQNVLPSMEAAFVDIGRGRNAVLYAGEVDWAGLGVESGQPKRIESVLKSGQSVLVQVTKDPVGHKGARLTSQISLPGRYLVYVPRGSMNGISRKLPENERGRLKTLLKEIVPEDAGVVVRTAAEGASEEELSRDVTRLEAQWQTIEKKASSGKAPELLLAEPDLLIKVVRDLFTEDFSKLVVSGGEAWDMVDGYVSHVAPHLMERVERWTSDEDLFAAYRIDEQIVKALDRKVWLPSGGSLIIERTEAMTVIDVNTGKFTGSGGNLEETVTKNNLEAAEEIVRQLRLRDIGGIVVIDFIDMVLESNRDLVLRRLVECLGRDRTKHQVAEVTSLGLVQMTRKRIGTGLLESFSEACDTCKGRGVKVRMDLVEDTGGAGSSNGTGGNGGSGSEEGGGGRRSRRRRRGSGSGSSGSSETTDTSDSGSGDAARTAAAKADPVTSESSEAPAAAERNGVSTQASAVIEPEQETGGGRPVSAEVTSSTAESEPTTAAGPAGSGETERSVNGASDSGDNGVGTDTGIETVGTEAGAEAGPQSDAEAAGSEAADTEAGAETAVNPTVASSNGTSPDRRGRNRRSDVPAETAERDGGTEHGETVESDSRLDVPAEPEGTADPDATAESSDAGESETGPDTDDAQDESETARPHRTRVRRRLNT